MSAAVVRYRKPAELARLGGRPAVVEASAGTGKTYVLEHLVIDLILEHGLELEQILVVTFTEKATAELVARVRAKIAALKDLGPADEAARAAAEAPAAECWTIDEPARQKLRRALLSFDRASISTIHGFCQRLLGENAFLHQRLFGEEVVDEGQAFHAAFVAALRRDLMPDPRRGPYVAAWLRSGRSLAKLETLLRRCHYELGCLHPPRPEALRPARFDQEALLRAIAGFPMLEETALAPVLKAARVHGSSVRKVSRLLAALARAAAEARASADPAGFLAALDAFRGGREDELVYLADHLRAVAARPELAPLAAAFAAVTEAAPPLGAALAALCLPAVEARLEARKREAGQFDFQDMLTLVARSLEGDGPRQRALVATLRARYRHALIDEFQDTDEVQWCIFRRLFFDAAADGLDGAAAPLVTVIGDPKQAIYGFRGADVHTYLRARREILEAGGAQIFLTRSFRSTAPLVDAQNAILDQEAGAPFFRREGRIHYDHPVRCGDERLELVDAAGAPVPPVVVLDIEAAPGAKEGALLTWQVRQAVKARMVDEIRRLLSPAGRLELRRGDGEARPIEARDVFVLTRTTRESREVGEALRAAGLPFAFYKQERLFETVEAREVLDLLRAIADPDDRTARARAFITAFFGMTLPDLAGCDDLPPGHPALARLHGWKALADAGDFERLFAAVVEQSGLVSREVFRGRGERALTNYLHLLEILQQLAAESRGTVRELAQTLAAYVSGSRKPSGHQSDIQRLETDADAVQIMTIHHAKGLEAGAVFVYGGFWPGPPGDLHVLHDDQGRRVVRIGRPPADEKAEHDGERDDEERRVLYVALTRARGRLYLPRYPAVFRQLRGAYRFVNARLQDLLDGFTPGPIRALFRRVSVPCPAAPPPPPPAVPTPVLRAWRPPADLVTSDTPDGAHRAIAERRAGFVVTSYSAVKRRHGGFVPATVEAEADDPADNEEAGAGEAPAELGPDELPRGRLSGSFLHELLEHVPLGPLRARPALAAWCVQPEVGALFERMRRRHERRAAHLGHAQRLVHTALTADVRLGALVVPGLAAADRAVREMEFVYPIPEAGQPLLEVAARAEAEQADRWRIERGVVKGFIDLLFEQAGRAYVCDWKGDWLPSWDPELLAAHCDRNYDTQARLYTLAALRLVGVRGREDYERRFGGVLYCFLRGRRADDPDAGVRFSRPSWQEVLGWQQEMLGTSFWGAP